MYSPDKIKELEEAKRILDEYREKGSIDERIANYLKIDAQFTVMLKEALEVDDGYVQP